jgi:condensin complex subunit 2
MSDDGDTPKAVRRALKKHTNDVYNDPDASFDEDRAPLRPVNINDDVAEKRRRRKSIKLVSQPEDLPELAKSKGRLLTSAAPPPVINVPLDVMSSNFEEWMKMATDNVRVFRFSFDTQV